jgi:hypothetical protein
MAKGEDPSATIQSKKKLIEDEQMQDDATSKPLQLQRRRVWRACESCRYVLIVLHPLSSALFFVLLFYKAQEDQMRWM